MLTRSLSSSVLALSCETNELQMAVTDMSLPPLPEDLQSDAEEILRSGQSKLAGEGNVSTLQ